MANRRRQTHFYDAATMKSLEGVPLPDKIKCGRCDKFKSHKNFSKKQLTDARRAVMNKARFKINCSPCTGGQLVEMECIMCHKTKGLEAFARSQRNKPDSAKCFACIEDQLAQRAIRDDIYEGDDRSQLFEPVETTGSEWPTVWTASTSTVTNGSEAGKEWVDEKRLDDDEDGGYKLSTAFQKATISDTVTETLIDSEYDGRSQANDDDGWNTVPAAKSWHTKSANTPSTKSGFDPNKYGKPPTRSTSDSASGSVRTFSSDFAERSDTTSNKGKWARIKAYDPEEDPDAVRMAKPVPEEHWSSESEQGDDDDDSDDDTEI